MKYISTRGKDFASSSYEAILKGLADDGGLFVREDFPEFSWKSYLEKDFSYADLAADLIHTFFDDIDLEDLKEMSSNAYDKKFYATNALNIHDLGEVSVVELYHGQTAAFKDFALSMLPQFLQRAKKDKKLIILTATSGDTGKAALEGFKDLDGIEIYVFYPTDGVSSMQKLQMQTQEGSNTHVIGVRGNFDDAQTGVKKIFRSDSAKKWNEENGFSFSSANSINIGRLVPQIVYYVYSYIKLVKDKKIKEGELVDICVPTGNFGDILAGYYAKEMGLPIESFICASNENDVLTDFFNTGIYNANRDLKVSTSPSMDILISSNLERILYHISKNSEKISAWMEDLKTKGIFEIDDKTKKGLEDFYGYSCDSKRAGEVIGEVFEKYGYLIDPHTAVAYSSIEKFREEKETKNHILLMSTASPYKFPEAVSKALGLDVSDFKEGLEKINEKTKMPIPIPLQGLDKKEIKHDMIIEKDNLEKIIRGQ